MFALPWNKVIIRRGGIELNPNAHLLPVPRGRRYREPEAELAVAKARMERVNAGEVPYALPCALPKAGDQNAIHQILAGPPAGAAPKRSNAANPLPEPATADPAAEELSKAAPFCQWHRSRAFIWTFILIINEVPLHVPVPIRMHVQVQCGI